MNLGLGLNLGRIIKNSTGPAPIPDDIAFFNAVSEEGGEMSNDEKNIFSSFISELKLGGLWPTLQYCLVTGAITEQAALIDIKKLQLATPANNPVHTPGFGYQSSSSGYVNTGLRSINAGVGPNNISLLIDIPTGATGTGGSDLGIYRDQGTYISAMSDNEKVSAIVNGVLADVDNVGVPGRYSATRSDSFIKLYKNGDEIYSADNSTTGSLDDTIFLILASNWGTDRVVTPQQYSTRQVALAAIAEYWNGSQMLIWDTAIVNLRSALEALA